MMEEPMPIRPLDRESFELWASRFSTEEVRQIGEWLSGVIAAREPGRSAPIEPAHVRDDLHALGGPDTVGAFSVGQRVLFTQRGTLVRFRRGEPVVQFDEAEEAICPAHLLSGVPDDPTRSQPQLLPFQVGGSERDYWRDREAERYVLDVVRGVSGRWGVAVVEAEASHRYAQNAPVNAPLLDMRGAILRLRERGIVWLSADNRLGFVEGDPVLAPAPLPVTPQLSALDQLLEDD